MDTSRAAAVAADDADPLAGVRARFTGTADDGPDRLLDLDGNSLGRLPVETPAAVARVVEQEWGSGLVGRNVGRIGSSISGGAVRPYIPPRHQPSSARVFRAEPYSYYRSLHAR